MDTSIVAAAAVDTLGRRVAPRQIRTIEEKARIVAETRARGVSVAEVARRHEVNAKQVFAWRQFCRPGVASAQC
jgi:transposase-like protein